MFSHTSDPAGSADGEAHRGELGERSEVGEGNVGTGLGRGVVQVPVHRVVVGVVDVVRDENWKGTWERGS